MATEPLWFHQPSPPHFGLNQMRKEHNSSLLPGNVQTIKQNSLTGSVFLAHVCREHAPLNPFLWFFLWWYLCAFRRYQQWHLTITPVNSVHGYFMPKGKKHTRTIDTLSFKKLDELVLVNNCEIKAYIQRSGTDLHLVQLSSDKQLLNQLLPAIDYCPEYLEPKHHIVPIG